MSASVLFLVLCMPSVLCLSWKNPGLIIFMMDVLFSHVYLTLLRSSFPFPLLFLSSTPNNNVLCNCHCEWIFGKNIPFRLSAAPYFYNKQIYSSGDKVWNRVAFTTCKRVSVYRYMKTCICMYHICGVCIDLSIYVCTCKQIILLQLVSWNLWNSKVIHILHVENEREKYAWEYIERSGSFTVKVNVSKF